MKGGLFWLLCGWATHSLAVNLQKRSVQFDKAVIDWRFDADDLTENGYINFTIRTKLEQFSFGWNHEKTHGGDLVYIHTNKYTTQDLAKYTVEAWKLTNVTVTSNENEISLTRSLKFSCDDPFEINAEAIRMIFATYTKGKGSKTQPINYRKSIFRASSLSNRDPLTSL